MFKNITRQFSLVTLLSLTFLLTACGGGSGSNAPLGTTYVGTINYIDDGKDISGTATMIVADGVVSGDWVQQQPNGSAKLGPITFRGTVSASGELAGDAMVTGFSYAKITGTVNTAAGTISGTVATHGSYSTGTLSLSKK